jgi:hypothetical protein
MRRSGRRPDARTDSMCPLRIDAPARDRVATVRADGLPPLSTRGTHQHHATPRLQRGRMHSTAPLTRDVQVPLRSTAPRGRATRPSQLRMVRGTLHAEGPEAPAVQPALREPPPGQQPRTRAREAPCTHLGPRRWHLPAVPHTHRPGPRLPPSLLSDARPRHTSCPRRQRRPIEPATRSPHLQLEQTGPRHLGGQGDPPRRRMTGHLPHGRSASLST